MRKSPPSDLTQRDLEDFVRALVSDKQGKLTNATQRYEAVIHRSKTAAAYYNLADIYRRAELLPQAIEAYEQYLAAAPDAADKPQVLRLVAKLKGAPAAVVLDGDTPGAIIFLDGKRMGSSPWTGPVAAGEHRAERFTATTYGSTTLTAKPPANIHVDINDHASTGNVVITGAPDLPGGGWSDDDVDYMLHQRFTLKPGRYSTFFLREGYGCTPLTFEVNKTGLTYVYVTVAAKSAQGCVPFTVKTQTITFDGGTP